MNHRGREKYGTVRVSTAYEFYEAVKEHLLFREKAYMNNSKPVFEATNYILYYFAADAKDADGKTHDYVLDRSKMWENTHVNGCSNAYEFVGLPSGKLNMRELPCPCGFCFAEHHALCSNLEIVPQFKEFTMREVITDAPEYLQLPLEDKKEYSVRVLKAFAKRYNLRVPGSIKKDDLIALILRQLTEYLLPVIDVII